LARPIDDAAVTATETLTDPRKEARENASRAESSALIWTRALQATAGIRREPLRLFADVVADNADRWPAKPALLSEAEELSYAALTARANRYARWALAQDVKPGDVVALLMPNRPDYVAFWLGVTQVGGVVALLNTNLSGASLAHCVKTAAPKHLVVAAELENAFAEAEPFLSPAPILWTCGPTSRPDGRRLHDAAFALDDAPLTPSERPAVTLSDRALLIYTSGTTGLPKAAHVSHHRIMTWSAWFAGLAGMNDGDRMYNCLPLYHSVGGVVAVGAPLVNGGSVVIQERFSARQFWDDVVRWDCTMFQYIGELCRYLLASPSHRQERAHRLRLGCGNGMSAAVWAPFQERFGVPRILEFYAATEANFSLYNVEGKVGAIGRIPSFLGPRNPVALVRHDFQRGSPFRGADGRCQRAGPGEIGEAIARISIDADDLSGRFEGYTNVAETEKKIVRDVFAPGDAWLRSGDLMRRDEQGFFYFVDRIGDTFRWKGENVATLEVANVLGACPGVNDAAVYGVEVPGAEGRAGMALLVTKEALDLRGLVQGVQKALPDYARPVFLRVRSELEITGTFKHKKGDIAREGFDPSTVADPLYVYDRAAGAYVALTQDRFEAIKNGAMRL
jgi:fatty-acyl-CoA synthase